MTTLGTRLREERKRLGFTQMNFGEAGGVKLNSQAKYERGVTSPDAKYLLEIDKLGADITYIITGRRSDSTPISPADISNLIDLVHHIADQKGLSLTREQFKTSLGFAFINGADEAAIAAFIDWQFPYDRSE